MNKQKCDYIPCEEEATEVVAVDGMLHYACKGHKKILQAQKKANNNY